MFSTWLPTKTSFCRFILGFKSQPWIFLKNPWWIWFVDHLAVHFRSFKWLNWLEMTTKMYPYFLAFCSIKKSRWSKMQRYSQNIVEHSMWVCFPLMHNHNLSFSACHWKSTTNNRISVRSMLNLYRKILLISCKNWLHCFCRMFY